MPTARVLQCPLPQREPLSSAPLPGLCHAPHPPGTATLRLCRQPLHEEESACNQLIGASTPVIKHSCPLGWETLQTSPVQRDSSQTSITQSIPAQDGLVPVLLG